MGNILTQIIADKSGELTATRQAVPLAEVRDRAADAPPTRSLTKSIRSHAGGIIAEFKRRSPSLGWIRREADVADIIPAYEAAGAAALSILTDKAYFGGCIDDISRARPLTSLPILRKEFVIDAYQLYEARAAGADACLLIAAAIGPARCHELAQLAHELGLEVILEVHEADELPACSPCVDVIGVNNRDLRSFVTDPERSIALRRYLPEGPLPISESGLLDARIAARLAAAGYSGFLIGEAFMKQPAPSEALRAYLEKLTSYQHTQA